MRCNNAERTHSAVTGSGSQRYGDFIPRNAAPNYIEGLVGVRQGRLITKADDEVDIGVSVCYICAILDAILPYLAFGYHSMLEVRRRVTCLVTMESVESDRDAFDRKNRGERI